MREYAKKCILAFRAGKKTRFGLLFWKLYHHLHDDLVSRKGQTWSKIMSLRLICNKGFKKVQNYKQRNEEVEE